MRHSSESPQDRQRARRQRRLWIAGAAALALLAIFILIVVHQVQQAKHQHEVESATPIAPATLTVYCRQAIAHQRSAQKTLGDRQIVFIELAPQVSIESIEALWGHPERPSGSGWMTEYSGKPALLKTWFFHFDHAGIAQSKPKGYCTHIAIFDILNNSRVRMSALEIPNHIRHRGP